MSNHKLFASEYNKLVTEFDRLLKEYKQENGIRRGGRPTVIYTDREFRRDTEKASRCPYYDSDCVKVKDPTLCWMDQFSLPIIPGYCPLMFQTFS